MQNLWIGSYKLRANVARFTGPDTFVHKDEEFPILNKDKAPKFDTLKPDPKFRRQNIGVSFKGRLTGVNEVATEEKIVVIPDVVNEFSDIHDRAVVVSVFDVDGLKKIPGLLEDMSPDYVKIQYMGELSVLITFPSNEIAESVRLKFLLHTDTIKTVTLWRGQSFHFERIAWLKIQGLPLNVVCNDTMNRIGSLFGNVVHKANVKQLDNDLSYEYVAVLVGEARRIMEEVVIQWRRRKFRVWVMEEIADWMPDFLFRRQEGDSTVNSDMRSSNFPVGNSGGAINDAVMVSPEKTVDEALIGELQETPDFVPVPKNSFNAFGNSNKGQSLPNNDVDLSNQFQSLADWEATDKVEFCLDAGIINGPANLSENLLGQVVKKKVHISNKKSQKSFQPRMVSTDDRPNPLKRPRLDFDPTCLDPFGLDVLLGLNNVAPVNGYGIIQDNITRHNEHVLGEKLQSIRTNEKVIDLNSQPENSGVSRGAVDRDIGHADASVPVMEQNSGF
ncbi:hypothetical protein HanRHA438_Chr01g0025091 [Helianthus annuus]|nr:hypothetical protein HanRHA438_Chr01g0025091 [Helianthus annuus]